MKIYLIGFMASGKTTAGKKLASRLGLDFTDLDQFIESENNAGIPEIFEKQGEEKFRELERKALEKISGKDNLVVSCGGGTPCFFNNIDLMNASGITVYLKVSVDTIMARLNAAKDDRPLLKGKTPEELRNFISDTLQKREPFYMRAHFKVKAKDLDVDALAVVLKSKLILNG